MYECADLEAIMPHKRDMILISRVVEYDIVDRKLTAEVDITPESMFFDDKMNKVPVWVGIEYMAQSIAALSGTHDVKEKHGEPKMGFIIGARNYECFVDGFKAGETLLVKIEQLFLDSELGSFACEIFHEKKLLAKTELNVFQPQSLEKFSGINN